jgi:chitinase
MVLDIDFEDTPSFTDTTTAGYDGATFLTTLTSALKSELPNIILTHAPQTPYWDGDAPYSRIDGQVGQLIDWYNNQFYNNPGYDDDPTTKIQWWNRIHQVVADPDKLLMGVAIDSSTGRVALDGSEIREVIADFLTTSVVL